MGQYHMVANLDRKEFLYPHKFGDGLKLLEFGCSANGTLTGLALLLASACKGGARGGGDIHPWRGGVGYEGREAPPMERPNFDTWEEYDEALMNHVVGRWAGDRLAIIGDYSEPGDVPGFTDKDWSEGITETGDGERMDLYSAMSDEVGGWIDISDVVNDAMDLDHYLHSSRQEPQKDVHGETIMMGDKPLLRRHFVGLDKRTAELLPDGNIESTKEGART